MWSCTPAPSSPLIIICRLLPRASKPQHQAVLLHPAASVSQPCSTQHVLHAEDSHYNVGMHSHGIQPPHRHLPDSPSKQKHQAVPRTTALYAARLVYRGFALRFKQCGHALSRHPASSSSSAGFSYGLASHNTRLYYCTLQLLCHTPALRSTFCMQRIRTTMWVCTPTASSLLIVICRILLRSKNTRLCRELLHSTQHVLRIEGLHYASSNVVMHSRGIQPPHHHLPASPTG